MIFYDIIAVFGCQQKQNRKARNGTQAIPYGNVIVPFDTGYQADVGIRPYNRTSLFVP